MNPTVPKSNRTQPAGASPQLRRLAWIFIFTFLQLALIGISFTIGYIVHEVVNSHNSPFPLLTEAVQILRDNALNPLPTDQKLEYGMIHGMVGVLGDPYSTFVEPPEHKLQSNQLEGKYGGIGVQLERNARQQILLYPSQDSPAEKSGIQKGDILQKVDQLDITAETTLDEVMAALSGKVGTAVSLEITRDPAAAPETIQVVRAEYIIPSVTWNMLADHPDVGVVHATLIALTTAEEIQRAIQDLKDQGAQDFILDLRNNGGGLVDAGVEIARLFLKDGTVITQQYHGKPEQTFDVTQPGALSEPPLVVVVNHSTASAAEIVAGALQGAGRAKLVGSPTYGKNTIQLVFTLSDQSSLHVTAARWWVPSLGPAPAPGKGLAPDVPVEESATTGSDLLQLAASQFQH